MPTFRREVEMMHIFNMTTTFTLAAFSTAPTWSLILMVFIVIVLIILMYRELWSLFTSKTTGVVLFVILAIFSILGGLLPQHYTQEEAARSLVKALPPEGVSLEMASQLMGLPHPGQVSPSRVAELLKYPDPLEITGHEAIEIMGEEPAPGVSAKDAYSGWLKREYNTLLIEAYGEWFEEKLRERAEDFKGAYKLDLFIPFYKIGFFRIYHTWYFLLVTYLFFTTVICCSIKRLQGYLRMRRREPVAYPEDRLKRQSEVEEFGFMKGELVDAKGVADILAARGLKPKACKKETDGYQLVLNFGFVLPHTVTSVIFHLGIFIALLGFLATGYYSWKGYVDFKEPGDAFNISYVKPDMKMYRLLANIHEQCGWAWANPERYYDTEDTFQLRCDDYWVEYRSNDDGWYDIKDWKSQLVVVEDDVEIKERVIEVNFPLTFHGIDFYQQTYEQWGTIEITAPDGRSGTAITGQGRMHTPGIPELDEWLYCSGLVSGTLMEKGKEPVAIGPKVRLGEVLPPKKEHWPNPGESEDEEGPREGEEENAKKMKGMPEFNWLIYLEDGQPVTWMDYTFELKGPYFASTGIEVRRDPGVPLLWVSVIIVMVMMVLRVYFPRYTARVDVTPTQAGGAHLIIAGRAYGLGANFRKRAERIAKILKAK